MAFTSVISSSSISEKTLVTAVFEALRTVFRPKSDNPQILPEIIRDAKLRREAARRSVDNLLK